MNNPKEIYCILDTLKEDKKEKGIHNKFLAKEIHVSEGTISNYFSGKYRIGLLDFIQIVKIVYEENVQKQQSMIMEFLRLSDKPDNIRISMEYASAQGDEILRGIVNKTLEEEKRSTYHWAVIYDLVDKRSDRKLNGMDIHKEVNKLAEDGEIKGTEMKLLSEILKMYGFLDVQSYRSLMDYHKDFKDELKEIPKKFTRESYQCRVEEMYAISHLYSGDINNARDISQRIVNTTGWNHYYPMFCASSYHVLAQTYIFEDPIQTLEYLQKGMDLLKNKHSSRQMRRRDVLKKTDTFTRIFWGIDLDNIEINDPAEQLHLSVRLGEKEKAHRLLDELEQGSSLTPFQMYYKALLLESKDLMEQSHKMFIESGNYLYSRLPLQELKK